MDVKAGNGSREVPMNEFMTSCLPGTDAFGGDLLWKWILYFLELVNDIHYIYKESRFFSIFSFVAPLLSEGIGSLAFGLLLSSVVSLFYDMQGRNRKRLLIPAVMLSVPLVLAIAETVLWYMDLRQCGKIIYYLLTTRWFRFLFLLVCTFASGLLFFLAFNEKNKE